MNATTVPAEHARSQQRTILGTACTAQQATPSKLCPDGVVGRGQSNGHEERLNCVRCYAFAIAFIDIHITMGILIFHNLSLRE